MRTCTVHVFTLDCSTTIFVNILQGLKISRACTNFAQRNPLLSEGTYIIIPLTKFEEHVSTLHHVSCPDKRADNQALIVKYFVKLHLKHFIPALLL